MKNRNLILILFIFAFAIRIGIYYQKGFPVEYETDSIDYIQLAMSLKDGKGYINKNGNPTSFRPPLYPLFLSAIFFLLGTNLVNVIIIQIFLWISGGCEFYREV